jgi:hypothetical protein
MSKPMIILPTAALLLSSAQLSAQENVREACMPDIRKHCSTEMMTFNRDDVRACLIKNIKKTSPACQAAAKARRDTERTKEGSS